MASYYVAKGRKTWRVVEQVYKGEKRTGRGVPRNAYEALGVNPDWTLEEARKRIAELNLQNRLGKKEVSKIAEAARRVQLINDSDAAFLPPRLVEAFIVQQEKNRVNLKRFYSCWAYIKKMVIELRLDPSEYADQKIQIFSYFSDQHTSPDYANKIRSILNKWGYFACKDRKQFFEPVPNPTGKYKSAIDDAYLDDDGYRGESEPLTPQMLNDKQRELTVPGNYEWLFISIWLGLRPIEVDGLHKANLWRLKKESDEDVIEVYQSKLTGVSRDKRWKSIPLFTDEQKRALKIIKAGIFKRPLQKTLNKVFGKRVTAYGGRKGFVDLMLNRNQNLENISMWLGHQSIETTWAKYRNRKRVNFTKVG